MNHPPVPASLLDAPATPSDTIPFATDDQLAARLRPVENKLRQLGEHALAAEVTAVLEILDPPARR